VVEAAREPRACTVISRTGDPTTRRRGNLPPGVSEVGLPTALRDPDSLPSSPARYPGVVAPQAPPGEATEDRNNPAVTFCVQGIMEHLGVEKMPEVLRATVPEARRWWRDSHDGPSTAEKTNMARKVFAEAILRWGPSVIPYVEKGLRDADPHVRAEAAAAVSQNVRDETGTLLRILKAALTRERSPWPRYEIERAIRYLESQAKK